MTRSTTAPRHAGRRRIDRVTAVTGAVLVLLASAALVAAVTTGDDDDTSGQSMPVGNLPGWQQTFSDDFTTPVTRGHFADSSYADRWSTYDGFTDTSKIGLYSNSGLSVHDGVLDMDIRTIAGIPRAAAVVPLVGGEWGGQTYGRFSVRMQADELDGYGAAFLLWSDANDWNDGEVDFPEGALAGTVYANNHCPGEPEQKCVNVPVDGITFQQWHTYTIDWTPDLLSFEVDGNVVASTDQDIPSKPLHWVMQVGTNDVLPPATTHGQVRIDWATIYSYAPGTAASSRTTPEQTPAATDPTPAATDPTTPADEPSAEPTAASRWSRWWSSWS